MTRLSTTQVTHLNRMNRASKDANLGTRISLMPVSGSHTVSTAEANASAVILDSGLGTIYGYLLQVFRSGSPQGSQWITNTSGSLTVKVSSGSLLSGDVVNYIVW
jgi:hypothetical protein